MKKRTLYLSEECCKKQNTGHIINKKANQSTNDLSQRNINSNNNDFKKLELPIGIIYKENKDSKKLSHPQIFEKIIINQPLNYTKISNNNVMGLFDKFVNCYNEEKINQEYFNKFINYFTLIKRVFQVENSDIFLDKINKLYNIVNFFDSHVNKNTLEYISFITKINEIKQIINLVETMLFVSNQAELIKKIMEIKKIMCAFNYVE
jgi:hypothetical protein